MEKPRETNHVQNVPYHLHLSSFFVLLFLLTTAVLFSACAAQNTGPSNASNTSNGASSTSASQTRGQFTPTVISSVSANGGYPIKVYFSQTNQSNNVVAVDRTSPTSEVANFAIEQLLAGPTQAEHNQGLFSQLHDSINASEPSSCANQGDFVLTLDMKGTVSEKGTASIQFCRTISSAGVGSDARIITEVTTTLTQFSSTIQKVVILTKDGHCFGDESGKDVCLS